MEGSALTEIPFLGPLFVGSTGAIALRFVAILACIGVGIYILRALVGTGSDRKREKDSAPRGSAASLARQGLPEAAGDRASRDGKWEQALGYYQQAGAHTKAGHAARRVGKYEQAAKHFEKGGELKLAVASYEAIGDDASVARVAARTKEPNLLAKAAAWNEKQGELLTAAEIYRKANMLPDAERCFLAVPEKGLVKAAQMYIDLTCDPGNASRARIQETARRGAELLLRMGHEGKAVDLCQRAGVDPTTVSPSLGKSGKRRQEDVAEAAPEEDHRIAAPISSLAPFDAPPPSSPAPPKHAEDSIEAPISTVDHFASGGDEMQATAVAAPKRGEDDDSGRSSSIPPGIFSADIAARYDILEEIGRGGMGEVYRARDITLGRTIAIKFLSGSFAGDKVAMKFFTREARAAAALNHPTIVTIYDFGILGGRPYITMEFVEGTDLMTRICDQGPLQEGHAVNVAIQVAQALHYAHEESVIHRDIKPSNIIQARGGAVKILDFGLAKAVRGDRKGTTIVAGTPEYMSPEQLAGAADDGRTDIFSLGVTLYEILTGELPFEGALRMSDPPPPSARAPWLNPALDEVLLTAMAIDPAARQQTGNELAGALRRALKSRSVPAEAP